MGKSKDKDFTPITLNDSMIEPKVGIYAVPWDIRVGMLITGLACGLEGHRQNHVVTGMTLEPVEPGEAYGDKAPTLKLDPHNVQALMDDLWSAGFRPSKDHGSPGALISTQNHLQDMRALVAKTLEVKL